VLFALVGSYYLINSLQLLRQGYPPKYALTSSISSPSSPLVAIF
jgi:hypothetical protein